MNCIPVRRLQALATCFLVALAAVDGYAAAPTEYKSPNGLQVLLRPIQGAKQAAVVTLFAIGGDHDPEGASGLGHFIEHVYVTAAAGDRPARTAEELMRAYPTGWNAQTGDDFTVFATVVDAAEVEDEIKQHAERMGNLRIAPSDLRRELPRIDQELANMFGRIPALAALNHAREGIRPTPWKGRKGGRIEQLRKVTLAELQSRWQQFYKPANAILIVAGKVDPAEVRPMIERAFGDIPAGDAAPAAHASPKREAARQPRSISVQPIQPGLGSTAALAFAAPKPGSSDYAPFLMLVNRLMAQARFAGFLQPTTQPRLRYAFLDDPNVLVITSELEPSDSTEQVAARLQEFVDQAVKAPWVESERAAAKQNLAFFLDTMPLPDAVFAQNAYGAAFAVGRRRQLGLDGQAVAKRLDQVTAKDLTRVGKEYFAADRGGVVVVRVESE